MTVEGPKPIERGKEFGEIRTVGNAKFLARFQHCLFTVWRLIHLADSLRVTVLFPNANHGLQLFDG